MALNARAKFISVDSGGGPPPPTGDFYLYADTDMIVVRDGQSQVGTQLFAISRYEDATKYVVYLAAENDNTDKIDRTFAYTKSKTDGLAPQLGWSVIETAGEPDIILGPGPNEYPVWDSGTTYNQNDKVTFGTSRYIAKRTNTNAQPDTSPDDWFADWQSHQTFLGTPITMDDGTYAAAYSANGGPIGISGNYGVDWATSPDLINWTKVNPLSEQPSLNPGLPTSEIHPKMWRDGSTLRLFTHKIGGGTNGRVYVVKYYTSPYDDDPNNWVWTLQAENILDGTDIGKDVLGAFSCFWKEGSTYYSYIGEELTGRYVANEGRLTQDKIAVQINLYSSTDLLTWTYEKTLINHAKQHSMGLLNLAGRFMIGGHETTVSGQYKWRGQSALVTIVEPQMNSMVLTTSAPTGGETLKPAGAASDVYPLYVSKYYRVRRADVDDTIVNPYEVYGDEVGTVVGSPAVAQLSGIRPATNGYVQFAGGSNVITDPNYFAIKFNWEYQFLFGDFPLVSIASSDTNASFICYYTSQRYRIVIDDGAGLRKSYRSVNPFSSYAESATTDYRASGLIWRNGVLNMCHDYNTNVPVTLERDDSFTALPVVNEPIRFGFLDGVEALVDIQSCVVMNGINNATEANWLRCDLI